MEEESRKAIKLLENMVQSISKVYEKIANGEETEAHTASVLSSAEELKRYLEALDLGECPPASDLGFDALPISIHLKEEM